MNKPLVFIFGLLLATRSFGYTSSQAFFYDGPFRNEKIIKRIKNKDSIHYEAITIIYWRSSFKDPIETQKDTATKMLTEPSLNDEIRLVTESPCLECRDLKRNLNRYQASSDAILAYPDCPTPALNLQPLRTPQEARDQFKRLEGYFNMYQSSNLVQEKLKALSKAESKAFESKAIIKISAYANEGERRENIDISTKEKMDN